MKSFDLATHLKEEHRITPVTQYLREIVYGGNDGIVTTFAVVAGFAGAERNVPASALPVLSVLLFGLANLFADGVSMSLGSFLSLRADQDVYRGTKAKELHEIVHEPEHEFEETLQILTDRGFTKTDAQTIAKLYRKNPAYWTEFMMKDELNMPNPESENPYLIALSTFLAFVIFGIIPLMPYVLFGSMANLFTLSLAFTALALILLGLLRAFVSQQSAIRGVAETLFLGSIAAGVAYYVGTFFHI